MREQISSQTIRVLINGEWRELPAGMTLVDLLRELKLANQPVAVERNLKVVPKSQHDETLLSEGDRLEIVTLVGGG
ncbi:MAG: sulfur carrier protein ThiS [Thermogutta sp.]